MTALLGGKYRAIETLGQGEAATTYLCEPADGGARVVVKRVSLRAALAGRGGTASLADPDAWKAIELFEREASVLRALEHPRVPRFIDFVRTETADDVELHLVQEHVPGRNLAQIVKGGRHLSEREVVDLGIRIATVLGDLHGHTPPIVHRDVKPSNVLLREDGEVFLIDFGAVMHRVPRPAGAGLDQATVVGTFGYMPLEQFEGRAGPASDVHALGATLAFLLTHRPPADIPRKDLRPDVGALVPISAPLGSLLHRMLAPDASERPADGRAVVDALRAVASASPPSPPRPAPRRWRRALLVAAAVGVGFLVVRAGDRPAEILSAVIVGEEPRRATLEPLPVGPPGRPAPMPPIFQKGGGAADDLVEDAAGNVWGRAWVLLDRFEDGDPTRPTTVFDNKQSLWKSLEKVDAGWTIFGIQRFAVAPDGDVYLLATRGELLVRRGLRWELLMGAGGYEPYRKHVTAMAVVNGELVLAGDGVSIRGRDGAWRQPVRLGGGGTVTAFAVTRSGAMLVSPGAGVSRIEGGRGKQIWWGGAATALFEDVQGHVFIGTENGFVEIDAEGTAAPRELEGMTITAFASRGPGRLWVGTARQGLHYREAGLWYRYGYAEGLPGRTVSELLIDRRGKLWVYADAMLTADAAAAEEAIKKVPRVGVRPALELESVAWAAEKLLGKRTRSGGVSWRRTADQTFVFFNGRLVHPGNAKFMAGPTGWQRPDGAGVVLARDWTGTTWDAQGTVRAIAAPPLPSGKYRSDPLHTFLDGGGRVWSTFMRDEVWTWENGVWSKHARLDQLTADAIVEDGRGRIWVATHKSGDGTLHRWDGKSWTGFKCRARWYPTADSLGIWNLALRSDGRLMVHLASSPDLLVVDPDAPALDCEKGQPFGYWAHLTEDRRGRFWSTNLWDVNGIKIRDGDLAWTIDSRVGLVDDWIVSHAEDAEGRLWLMSGSGRITLYPSDVLAQMGRPPPRPDAGVGADGRQ